ncbi:MULTISPECIES: HAD family acid phosphatase [unclassified Streptomyces]|uniref:HAD family acid phosphatase n=1 Tax=unclassified Streptomyces TaxID=2593676 RepID=UPI000372FA30|nr:MULTISPECIES: HAD family acid phosphatase [unclassified Streptomyces]MYX30005.1 hydrolase [Streptomyces sp. SID8381]
MSTGTWARRTGMTAVATVAVTALAVPVGAQAATDAPAAAPAAATARTTPTSTAEAAAASGKVGYDAWQQDCRTVMDRALPYLRERIASARPGEKQAVVLDIDNTALETDFGFSFPQPANQPVLTAARYAQEHGVALFFVTARPGIIAAPTEWNLEHDGYRVTGLRVRGLLDLFKDVAAYKTAQRAAIEKDGYTIIANIGNSPTDLSGGHAEKTFKLPDYDGQLS